MNNVTVCKKDACLSIKGELAGFVAFTIAFVMLAYGVSLVAKAIR